MEGSAPTSGITWPAAKLRGAGASRWTWSAGSGSAATSSRTPGAPGRSLGVRLAIDDDPMRLAEDVGRFALIVIEVSSSADGRFFSIAARLREHLRYRHELRITGDVAPDQLSFMRRCGIDAFEVGDHVDAERFIRRYRRFYQSSGPLTTRDNLIPLARRRVRSGNTAPFEDRRRRRREAGEPQRAVDTYRPVQ